MTSSPAGPAETKTPAAINLEPSPSALALRSHEKAWQAATTKLDQTAAPAYAVALDSWGEIVVKIIKSQAEESRADSWANALTGIGTSRDKMMATHFLADCQLQFSILEALYHQNDMAARICDAVPGQMFREGYELHINEDDEKPKAKPGEEPEAKTDADDNADEADALETALEDLGADDALEEGFIWGGLYGGAKGLLGVNDGRKEDQPVDEANIQSIDYITILDRYALFPMKWYDDPKHPKFGEPEVYRILIPAGSNPVGLSQMQVGAEVHETRLLHFPGARTSLRRKRANLGWDDSVLQRVYDVLMQFGVAWASGTHLLADASQAVITLNGLLEGLAGNNKEVIAARAALMDQTRSSVRALLLDAEAGESFERHATPFTGIPEMLDRTSQRLAAAARMPLTVLMGISPAGLNATGDSDIRNWYDQIASMQRRILKPRLKRLLKLLMLAKKGPTGGKELDVEICFKPLWQLTPLEEADRRLKVAQKDAIEIDKGIVTAEEVAQSRYGARGYSPETKIDLKLREELAAGDDQAAQLGAGKMAAEKELAQQNAVAVSNGQGEKPAAGGKPPRPPADK